MSAIQLHMDLPIPIGGDHYNYGTRSSGETHGVVLTKPHVVGLILDLAGYDSARDLGAARLLEPSCGHGAFLVQAVVRLLASARKHGREVSELRGAIVSYDVDAAHVAIARRNVAEVLMLEGTNETLAASLASTWINVGDFLLAEIDGRFEFVVGNPPYIRIEQISPLLQSEYRRRYSSIYDRADLYVAFIERGLALLSKDGVLSFVCADRWTLNKYGAPLRALLSSRFGVRCYVDLHRASPFESDVIAYPSIFAIGTEKAANVRVCRLETASPEECSRLPSLLQRGVNASDTGVSVSVYETWFQSDEPWVLSSPQQLAMLRDLEARFSPIEETSKVGIGVATGNDSVYIVDAAVDIEPDRLVPLVMRSDIEGGAVKSAQRFVVNVFGDNGKVVDLAAYPRLRNYIESHATQIKRRHVAQKNPLSWFRTIDRVYPELAATPKLLIPDIAGSNEVVFERGRFHPHHNLYFVTSNVWDLEVLGGLLSSKVALFFVWSYAVKMRGGYLRFQAQYLRRIRLPDPSSLPAHLHKSLKAAFRKRDFGALDELALQAYELTTLPDFDFSDTRK